MVLPTRRSRRIKQNSLVAEQPRRVKTTTMYNDEEPEVPEYLLTQPFHGDSSSDEECDEAEEAFLNGDYTPKSLLRDRDIGDPPLQLVIQTHKKRVIHQRAAARRKSQHNNQQNHSKSNGRNTRNSRKMDHLVEPSQALLFAQGKRKRIRKRTKNGRKSAPVKGSATANGKPFLFDFVSGLESDSSSDGEDLETISRRCNEQFARIEAIIRQRSW